MSDDVPRYRCAVDACPMFGGIFLAGAHSAGVCAWHFGATGHDVERITQALADWDCVTYEINRWRTALLHVELDPDALAKAWTRLQPALAMSIAEGLAPTEGQSYAQWGHTLQRFLLGVVKDIVRRKAA